MRSVFHRRVHKFCDLPNAVKLDGRVWRFQSLGFGSNRVGYVTLGSLLLRTVDGGESWRYLGRIAPPGFGASRIFSRGPTRSWVACESATGARPGPIPVLSTEDGGKHWDTTWVGDSRAKYGSKMDLFFADDHRGWLVATHYSDSGPSAALFSTTDGGSHWQFLETYSNVRPQAVMFRNGLEGYLLAAAPQQYRRRAVFVNLQDGTTKSEFLVGGHSSVLFRLSAGGRESAPVLKTTSSLYALRAVDSTTIAMCGAGGCIIREGELGGGWKRTRTRTRADLNDASFASRRNETVGLAVGEGGVILGSADGGKTWKKLQHTIGECGFRAVEMLGVSSAIVAASDALYLLDLGEVPTREAHGTPHM